MSSLEVIFSLEGARSHKERGMMNARSGRALWSAFGQELPHTRRDVRGRVVGLEQPCWPHSHDLGAKNGRVYFMTASW